MRLVFCPSQAHSPSSRSNNSGPEVFARIGFGCKKRIAENARMLVQISRIFIHPSESLPRRRLLLNQQIAIFLEAAQNRVNIRHIIVKVRRDAQIVISAGCDNALRSESIDELV